MGNMYVRSGEKAVLTLGRYHDLGGVTRSLLRQMARLQLYFYKINKIDEN